MFVVSIKMSRKNKIALASVVLMLMAGIMLLNFGRAESLIRPAAKNRPTTQASIKNSQDVALFLEKFGWKIDSDSLELDQVIIPLEFNEVYTAYNQLQQKQNYNLERYKGMTVQRYRFEVKNYPNQPQDVIANVLVENNMVIGGDITSRQPNGFSHGFSPK